jgi:ribosomal protein L34
MCVADTSSTETLRASSGAGTNVTPARRAKQRPGARRTAELVGLHAFRLLRRAQVIHETAAERIGAPVPVIISCARCAGFRAERFRGQGRAVVTARSLEAVAHVLAAHPDEYEQHVAGGAR